MIFDEFSLQGKVAIITGAGRGIGKAISLAFAAAGADIVAAARTKEEIEETCREVRDMGRQSLAIPTDVTRADPVDKMVEETVSHFKKIDILVNNAGILMVKPIVSLAGERLTEEEWHEVMDTNLTSIFLCCRAVGPHMFKQKKGKVINISSGSADLGTPYWAPYCTSKAALSMFTRCLASEWAPFNICVNAIGPGNTRTEMMGKIMKENQKAAEWVLAAIPMGRLAEPREIALLAFYLASDASNFLTGQTIYIDGGQLGMGRGP